MLVLWGLIFASNKIQRIYVAHWHHIQHEFPSRDAEKQTTKIEENVYQTFGNEGFEDSFDDPVP